MVTDLAGKRVLVLSDNDGLSGAIELNLKRSHLKVTRLALNSSRQRYPEPFDYAQDRPLGVYSERSRTAQDAPVEGPRPEPFDYTQDAPVEGRVSQTEIGDFDLIVVAMSSSNSEPVVALARASLAGSIGQVPLLIISDRPFHSEPDDQITHLDFPFDADGLQAKVKEILQGSSDPTLTNVR